MLGSRQTPLIITSIKAWPNPTLRFQCGPNTPASSSIIQHHPASSITLSPVRSRTPYSQDEARGSMPVMRTAVHLPEAKTCKLGQLPQFQASKSFQLPPMARKASCQWRSRITHRGRIAWQPLSMSTEEKEYVAYVALVLYSQYSQLRHNGCLRRTQKVLLSIPVNLVDVYGPKFNRMFCRNLPNAKRNIGPRCVQAQI